MNPNWSDLDRPSLRQQQLRAALVAQNGLFTDVTVVERTTSTNADLVRLARAGAAQGVVLVAEQQTAGRGRMDRTWTAPARAALTFSVLLRPDFAPSRWPWLPLLAAVAVAAPLARISQLNVRVKWPNDVLIGELKVAGILAERVDDAVVLGIGLNVLQRADELPVETATSLALAGSAVVGRDPVLRTILRALARLYADLRGAGGDADAAGLRSAYLGHCATVNRQVVVELPGGRVITGEATGVDDEGRLEVRAGSGREAVGAGDVVHVR